MTKSKQANAADTSIDPELTYADALDELEELLAQLESADVDVDLLASQVARGVELVRFCQARLAVVTTDVDQVVAELLDPDADLDSEEE